MIANKEKYDALFELLADAEMELRNGNYWQVVHKLEDAAALAKKYARDETTNT